MERVRLGESATPTEAPKLGVPLCDVVDAFYSFLSPPRLDSAEAIRKAVIDGVTQGLFSYTSGTAPTLGPDGRYQVAQSKIAYQKTLFDDEIDLETGFLIAPAAVPAPPVISPGSSGSEPGPASGGGTGPTADSGGSGDTSPDPGPSDGGGPGPEPDTKPKTFRYRFAANREQVYGAFQAVAILAEKAEDGNVVIEIEATNQAGFDPNWLRNAVQEPLDEADVETR